MCYSFHTPEMNYTAPFTFGGFLVGLQYSRYKWKIDNPYGDQFETISRPIYASYYGIIGLSLGFASGMVVKIVRKK